MATPEDITLLLRSIEEGNTRAIDELFPLVYEELRGLAKHHFRGQSSDHTLQPTALIHEAYLRMVRTDELAVRDRAHFFALASRVMRQLLVDHCRRKRSAKRGGDRVQVTLGPDTPAPGAAGAADTHALEVLALDEALFELAELDPRKSQVVELRYFGGLTIDEAATALGVSGRTIESDWAMARAWLRRRIDGPSSPGALPEAP